MAKNKKRKNIQKEERVEAKVRRAVLYFLHVNHDRPFNHKQIAAGADLGGKISHNKLVSVLEELAESGKIVKVDRGRYLAEMQAKTTSGKLEVTRDGFGFVVLEDAEARDVFIPPTKMGKALNGDTVKIRILRSAKGENRAEGEVVEVLERNTDIFIGKIEILNKTAFFLCDDPRINLDFFIPPGKLKGAEDRDKVLLKMVDWTGRSPEGEVIRVLGKEGENETEMHAILFQFGFDPEFPSTVEAEAEKINPGITAKEVKKRRDFRKVTTFTIDPPDAKDFDDALSFEYLENGRIEVGVHIADVSFYVQQGSAIDEEGFNRATSVYLVDRTVPMLPEKLSNGLCSLRPNEDRLTFSAVFEMDLDGTIHKQWFGRTVIHSDRRFTYDEAQQGIETGKGDFAEELRILNSLAKYFRKERFKHGSIDFEEDEVKFELDEKGKPIRVFRKIRKDAHKMIEDWMLLANRSVTEYVYKLRKELPLPFVYRIHDRPDEEKLANLQQFAATLGHRLDLSNPARIAVAMNQLMHEVEGKPEQDMIRTVAVRSMAKAVYSTENIGHYGLGFEFYTHFTSPIRRYPDMMVHRLLAQYLDGNFSASPDRMEIAAKHCSARERRAVEAERASVKYKQVEFLEEHIGAQFEGIVSGVTRWGIYVEIIENMCEGMISLYDMKDDYYEVDTENYCVRGRSSGNIIRLGDKLMIEVKGTNLRNRTIDFMMIEHLESSVEGLDSLPLPPLKSKPSGRGGRSGGQGSKNQKPKSKGKQGGRGGKNKFRRK